jgi:translocation and assembly module TamA
MDARTRASREGSRVHIASRVLVALLAAIFSVAHAADEPVAVTLTVTGVDDAQRRAILEALDLAQYGSRPTIPPARFQRLLKIAPQQVGVAMEIFGYYNATTVPEAKPLGDDRYAVTLAVTPGPPVVVNTLAIDIAGSTGRPSWLEDEFDGFRPREGETFDHALYSASKAAVERTFARLGYFEWQPVEHAVKINRAQNTADIALRWTTGPRYKYGEATFEGSHIREPYLRRLLTFKPGEYYNQSELVRLQQSLAATDFFTQIDVAPATEPNAERIVPVKITLTPAKRNRYTAGVSYDADFGAGVRLGGLRRWVNGRGDTLRWDIEQSEQRQSFGTEYRIPRLVSADALFGIGFRYRNEDTDIVDSRSYQVGVSALDNWRGWTRTISGNILNSDYVVGETLAEPPEEIRRTTTVVYPELVLTRVGARDRIRPRSGYALRLEARGGAKAVLSDVDFVQIRAEARWIRSLGDKSRLLVRGEAGLTEVDDLLDMPPELRFYAGGDRSVRGYEFRGLGERGVDDKPLGGRNVLAASIEFEREFRPKWSWAVFVDSGDAFNGASPDLHHGVGVGVRWNSPVGPVRLDIAHGLDEPRRSIEFYISAGPDL